jgi:hypothetical protein
MALTGQMVQLIGSHPKEDPPKGSGVVQIRVVEVE